ncbi:ComEA family DNA-binding protein [Streptomyces sp. NPDC000594]|uniref:ComEA family DNA-binding protein n=1 Tax=Streptomyces sp. NPDC000594 TaxID=3154261 RepID=UPI003327B495
MPGPWVDPAPLFPAGPPSIPRADPALGRSADPLPTHSADPELPGGAAGTGGGGLGRWLPALRDRLPLWVRLRCGLAPRTLAALAVVLLAATVLAVHHFVTGRPAGVSAPEQVRPGLAGAAPRPLSAPAERTGARVVIDVSGKVRRPGVLRLPTGSRVADALAAAGGAAQGADLTALNRARVLIDGEQLVVGAPRPPQPPQRPGAAAPAGGAVGTAGTPGVAGQAGPPGAVSLSTATAEQLDALPGVGPVLARHIIDHRTRHGGFRSVEQLRDVRGIGDRRFADLRTLVGP